MAEICFLAGPEQGRVPGLPGLGPNPGLAPGWPRKVEAQGGFRTVIRLFLRGCAAMAPVPVTFGVPHPGQAAPHAMEFTMNLPRLGSRQGPWTRSRTRFSPVRTGTRRDIDASGGH